MKSLNDTSALDNRNNYGSRILTYTKQTKKQNK